MSTAAVPRTTIAVVPRESYSVTPKMLENLLAHTPSPRRVVIVDGNSPPRIRRHLERVASASDITLLHRGAAITANEARNQAMRHVTTEFVCFVDNDTFVDDGWLAGLERCAEETGAWLVAPAVLWGRRDRWEVHYAGGLCHIADDAGARRLVETNTHMHRPPSALTELTRAPTEYLETHCALARVDALQRIGPFDEGLVAAREHTTLALQVSDLGGGIWLEPSVVVRYPWPKRNTLADWRFYLPRWSDEWAERSFRRFNETWQLTDLAIDDVYREGHLERRLGQRRVAGNGIRARSRTLVRGVRRGLDRVVTPLAVKASDRRRARRGSPRVLHTASWDTA